MNIYYL